VGADQLFAVEAGMRVVLDNFVPQIGVSVGVLFPVYVVHVIIIDGVPQDGMETEERKEGRKEVYTGAVPLRNSRGP
jgi:hypothetical protein